MDKAKIYHDMTDAELNAAYKSKKQELFKKWHGDSKKEKSAD